MKYLPTDNLSKEGLGKGAAKYGTVKNSYGNVYIDADIKKGASDSEIARRIHERYPDISIQRGMQISEQIRKEGPNASVDWSKDLKNEDSANLGFDSTQKTTTAERAKEKENVAGRCDLCGIDLPEDKTRCPQCVAETNEKMGGVKLNVDEGYAWRCQECGHKFASAAAAERAVSSDRGCPKCGGTDVDESLPIKNNAGDGLWHLDYGGAGQPACGKVTSEGYHVAKDDKDVNCPKCLAIAERANHEGEPGPIIAPGARVGYAQNDAVSGGEEGDLDEINRHAEGIEHEVAELKEGEESQNADKQSFTFVDVQGEEDTVQAESEDSAWKAVAHKWGTAEAEIREWLTLKNAAGLSCEDCGKAITEETAATIDAHRAGKALCEDCFQKRGMKHGSENAADACSFCKGTGVHKTECGDCHGSGKQGGADCKVCGGTGAHEVKCGDCRGTGKLENARPFRCSCGGTIEKIGEDRFECDECGKLFETDDWRADRLKPIENMPDGTMTDPEHREEDGKNLTPKQNAADPESKCTREICGDKYKDHLRNGGSCTVCACMNFVGQAKENEVSDEEAKKIWFGANLHKMEALLERLGFDMELAEKGWDALPEDAKAALKGNLRKHARANDAAPDRGLFRDGVSQGNARYGSKRQNVVADPMGKDGGAAENGGERGAVENKEISKEEVGKEIGHHEKEMPPAQAVAVALKEAGLSKNK